MVIKSQDRLKITHGPISEKGILLISLGVPLRFCGETAGAKSPPTLRKTGVKWAALGFSACACLLSYLLLGYNTKTKGNLGRKGFVYTMHSSQSIVKEIRTGSQG